MRTLSALELALVSGGSLWEDILEFFSLDGGSGGTIQTVHVSAQRMTDTQKFAYDIEQIRNALPDCQITFTYTGTVSSGTVSVGAEKGVPNGSGGVTLTHTMPSTTYVCPPKSGIPQHPSD